jgi:hypothetical protein
VPSRNNYCEVKVTMLYRYKHCEVTVTELSNKWVLRGNVYNGIIVTTTGSEYHSALLEVPILR